MSKVEDEATTAYEESIGRAEKLDDRRQVATNKFQLGIVRRRQQRYKEALAIFAETRDIFTGLGEPKSVANAWHQIGMVHKNARQFEQAEQAYRHSLAIRVQQKYLMDEASSLGELSNLYVATEQPEEAVKGCSQAVNIYVRLQDQRYEGVARSNLAQMLIRLERYDEARRELHRAIECKKPYGHVAEPWKTWAILHHLEQVTGHAQAAAEVRGQAVASYLAYRRAGGESRANTPPLYALVAQAVKQGTTTEAATQLAEYARPDDPAWLTALLNKLQAILRGDRDPALAADPALNYGDVVELTLLLEALAK